MDKTLQDALASLINKTVDGVEASTAFLSAELPDYIVQMLMWYGVYNFILFLTPVVLSLVLYRYIKNTETWVCTATQANGHYDGPTIRMGVTIGLLMVTMAALATGLNLTWLKIWIAPKVWLVEYAASLASKASGG